MCGFTGIVCNNNNNAPNFECEIKAMLSNIAHRGPDDSKLYIDSRNGIYIGFSRLSMIDIKNSRQPYCEKQYIVVYNGEIYNYKQLRSRLSGMGEIFRTNGEVEVVLKMYLHFGNDFVKHLDGMFSICIVNLQTNEVFLARDRFGIKPLYYSVSDGIICFCSELKALPCFAKQEIEEKALALYFYLRFIPAPFAIYKNVFKVKAGEYICIDGHANITITQYHPYNTENRTHTLEYTNLSEILTEAIYTTHNSSDVPIGLFLSGGIDSGIIASLLKNETRTFSVGHVAPGFHDYEMDKINSISTALQILPNRTIISNGVLELLNDAIYYLDEPFYSSVAISTYALSKLASNHVKGIMTGDGSDELLFGYEYLRTAIFSSFEYDSYLSGIGWLKFDNPKDWLISCTLNKDDIKHILFSDCEISNNISETLRRVELYKRLPDYHMMRIDKLTMACGLEARVPYLRNDYVDFMLSIDSHVFLDKKDTKSVLKEAFGNVLPHSLLSTTKKPFTAPIKHWLEHELKEDVYRLLCNSKLMQKIPVNTRKIRLSLINYQGTYADVSNLWGVYVLLKWCEINLE